MIFHKFLYIKSVHGTLHENYESFLNSVTKLECVVKMQMMSNKLKIDEEAMVKF